MEKEIIFKDLTEKVIGCFYEVYNELGGGFLESVYEKSLMVEFIKRGLEAESQKRLDVFYKEEIVGDFRADIIVEDRVLIEIKAVNRLIPIHEAQLLNYLKATGIPVGFLVNFGKTVDFMRKVF